MVMHSTYSVGPLTEISQPSTRILARLDLLRYLSSCFLILTVIGLAYRVGFSIISETNEADKDALMLLYSLGFGIRFDMAIAAFLTIAVTAYAILKTLFFNTHTLGIYPIVFCNIVLLLALIGDTAYYLDNGYHLGYEVRDIIFDSSVFFASLEKNYFVILIAGLSAPIIHILVRKYVHPFHATNQLVVVPGTIWILVALVAIRGGFSGTPMNPATSYALGGERWPAIAHNAGYAIFFRLLDNERIEHIVKISPDRTIVASPGDQNNSSTVAFKTPGVQANVLIITLKKWPGRLTPDFHLSLKAATPEFHALRGRGLSAQGMISSGRRTKEKLFGILCSYPDPLGGAIVSNRLFDYRYECLPEILQKAGWQTAAFQGSEHGQVSELMQKLGITRSYNKDSINSNATPVTGVTASQLYNFVLDQAKNEKTPFLYLINARSTSEQAPNREIPAAPVGSKTPGKKIRSLYYADRALGNFIRDFEQTIRQPTIVVLVSDHVIDNFSNNLGYFYIPFTMLTLNADFKPRHLNEIVSQRDISPTIIDWLDGYVPWFTGTSMSQNRGENSLQGDYFRHGMLGAVRGERLVEFPVTAPDMPVCYRWRADLKQEKEVTCDEEDEKIVATMLNFTIKTQRLLFQGSTQLYR